METKDWKVVRDRHGHVGKVEVLGPGVGGSLVIGFEVATNVDAARAAQVNDEARLIAAAPTLLAACKSMLATCGGSQHWQGETHESLLLIEAAIAAATQGSET